VVRDLDGAVAVRIGLHDQENAARAAYSRADGAEVPAKPIKIDLNPGGEFHVVSAANRPPDEYHTGCAEASRALGDRPAPAYTARLAETPRPSPPAPDRDTFGAAAAELLDLVRHLSGPDGCPWDREQTTKSLSPYVVEEAHEIADAIVAEDRRAAAEELGDLLFLVTFLAVRLEQEGGPAPAKIARGNIAKMIARHPHVFGDTRAEDAQEVLRLWEERKRLEAGHESILGKSPAGLPALLRAYRIQEKASSVGFDWPDVEGVAKKLREELDEVEAAVRSGNAAETAAELGDLLFAAVNLARYLKIDPEARLRAATDKFRSRFDRVTELLRERGEAPEQTSLEELDRLWEQAKREGR
jgi:MazG family protein